MSAELVFVDTNVLVYARDASELVKQPLALSWLDMLWESNRGRLSIQVLNEFYVTVTRKLNPGLTLEEAREDVRGLLTWEPIPLDSVSIDGAFGVQDRYGFSFWDALIVMAAHLSGTRYLLSEDLQDGQDLQGVLVVDPFSHTAEEILGVAGSA